MPEVLDFSASFENVSERPYMITSFIQGRCLQDVLEEMVDHTSGEMEDRRITIVQSIAKNAARLSRHQFSAGGMLKFKDDDSAPEIVGPIKISYGSNVRNSAYLSKLNDKSVYSEVHTSYQKYARGVLDSWYKSWARSGDIAVGEGDEEEELDEDKLLCLRGMDRCYRIMLDCLPNAPVQSFSASLLSTPSTSGPTEECQEEFPADVFTLAIPDFDSQNIMVDEESGEVTGFLDWDGIHTLPAMLGWARLPFFLFEDWKVSYDGSSNADDVPPGEFDKYRKAYADALKEAYAELKTDGDGHVNGLQFIGKSHMISGLEMALGGDPHMVQFLSKVLEMLRPGIELDEFVREMGRVERGSVFETRPGFETESELRAAIKELFSAS
ncbi:hypothetical protein K402DRAFT_105396 [Aulographum hederae CBS 113979]|uniref:Aminoglycoside phosphotransferase domain-containing protein n=1 Tax=Aulographum hederae CBS 113979 TaxID=1176131 RepID=A0A6G1GXF8_9PEZI|nr:hypothetical protein K402DRAFT_105396 [Aulographum hederae CBS 113979]